MPLPSHVPVTCHPPSPAHSHHEQTMQGEPSHWMMILWRRCVWSSREDHVNNLLQGVYIKDDDDLRIQITRNQRGGLICKGAQILGGSADVTYPAFDVVWREWGAKTFRVVDEQCSALMESGNYRWTKVVPGQHSSPCDEAVLPSLSSLARCSPDDLCLCGVYRKRDGRFLIHTTPRAHGGTQIHTRALEHTQIPPPVCLIGIGCAAQQWASTRDPSKSRRWVTGMFRLGN